MINSGKENGPEMIAPTPDGQSAAHFADVSAHDAFAQSDRQSSQDRPDRYADGRRHEGDTASPSIRRQQLESLLRPLTPLGFLMALRRRVKVALVIGVPLAIAAVAVCWLAVPAHYTAFALLKIAAREPRLVFQTAENTSDFATYHKTQIALIKSRFVLNAALRRPGIAELTSVQEKQYPLQWLQAQLEVDSHQSPEILRIGMRGDRPEELAALVNAVKDAYLEEVVNAERRQRISRLNDLERIFEETEAKVRARDERVSKLAKQLGSGDSKALTIKQQMALEYFAELRREHARVRFQLMRTQVGGEALDALTNDPGQRTPIAAGGGEQDLAVTDDFRSSLAARRIRQLKDLIARYETLVVDKEHPTLVRYRNELDELKKALGDPETADALGLGAGQSRLQVLKRQEELLREEVDKYSDFVNDIGTSSFELEAMQAEIAQIERVSNSVGTEMEALRIELQSPARVTLLQEADVPQTRDMTRKQRLTSASGLGVLGMVLLCVGLIEFRAHRVGEPKELRDLLRLDILGTLPGMPRPGLATGLLGKESRRALWNNALIESVDGIRSILLHDPDCDARRAIMVASATSGEGKTTFACQLAGSLARSGRRTILVDSDLRRPRAHQLLQTALEPGLAEYLSDDLLLETVIQASAEPNLWAIAAGRMNETSLQTLARHGAKPLFDALRKDYEFIIVDSSPLLYVADSGAIGHNVDGVILTTRQDVSRLPVTAAACERLGLLGIPLIGAVMVGVRSQCDGYGYSYDYQHSSGGQP